MLRFMRLCLWGIDLSLHGTGFHQLVNELWVFPFQTFIDAPCGCAVAAQCFLDKLKFVVREFGEERSETKVWFGEAGHQANPMTSARY
ncbi:MAG TPA: hypothetical protein VGG72_20890 [Bryobacteraceae bacterium]|jgi:hypothetical protein